MYTEFIVANTGIYTGALFAIMEFFVRAGVFVYLIPRCSRFGELKFTLKTESKILKRKVFAKIIFYKTKNIYIYFCINIICDLLYHVLF